VLLAGLGAELINLDDIVGAFLAGLALNPLIKNSPAREKLEFLGNVLFIPAFFFNIGILINVPVFIKTMQAQFGLVLVIVGALFVGKYLAAYVAKLLYRYKTSEMLLMWSLSLPQVAATLAAALVAYKTVNGRGDRLIEEPVLSSILVLVVVTSILGPLLSAKYAKQFVTSGGDHVGR
jgi:Kef-type K+ transport system membrane component KefB